MLFVNNHQEEEQARLWPQEDSDRKQRECRGHVMTWGLGIVLIGWSLFVLIHDHTLFFGRNSKLCGTSHIWLLVLANAATAPLLVRLPPAHPVTAVTLLALVAWGTMALFYPWCHDDPSQVATRGTLTWSTALFYWVTHNLAFSTSCTFLLAGNRLD